MVDYFIAALKKNNPGVNLQVIMLDFDWCQINAARRHHPTALVLLCWWHVLHAWQQHLHINQHLELWKLLKGWIHLTEITEFNEYWVQIQSLVPTYFIEYIQNTWWKHWKMWSTMTHTDCIVYQLSDTNMLVKVYIFLQFLLELGI